MFLSFFLNNIEHYAIKFAGPLVIISVLLAIFLLYLSLHPGETYFKDFIDISRPFGRQKTAFILGFIYVVGIITPLILTPTFQYLDTPQRYIIDDDYRRDGEWHAKKEIRRDFSFSRKGHFLTLASLNFEGLDLEKNDLHFEYTFTDEKTGKDKWGRGRLELSSKKRDYSTFGIEDYEYHENENLIIKINKPVFLRNNVSNLFVIGTEPGNIPISNKFRIEFTELVCNNGNCSQNISFINNLDYRVSESSDSRTTLLNESLFERQCELYDVTGIKDLENKFIDFTKDPDGDSYVYSIDLFKSNFRIVINGHLLKRLNVHGFGIGNNSRIDLTFHYTCS